MNIDTLNAQNAALIRQWIGHEHTSLCDQTECNHKSKVETQQLSNIVYKRVVRRR